MSHFEKFVIEGNEKADELAKAGAMMDEGFMAEARAKTLQQKKRRSVRGLAVRGQLSLKWRNGRIVKSSSRSQKKSGFSWMRRGKKRSIVRSGVLMATCIDV